jgi:hypothetical protein
MALARAFLTAKTTNTIVFEITKDGKWLELLEVITSNLM